MLYGNLTGAENLRFFCRLFDVPEPEEQISKLLDEVNLRQRSRDLVRTYSRGMQQRLSIARALVHSPECLFMDEPYTGLDQGSAERLDWIAQELRLQRWNSAACDARPGKSVPGLHASGHSAPGKNRVLWTG